MTTPAAEPLALLAAADPRTAAGLCELACDALGAAAAAVTSCGPAGAAVLAAVERRGAGRLPGLPPGSYADAAARGAAGLAGHVRVPLRGRDGEPLGALDAVAAEPLAVGPGALRLLDLAAAALARDLEVDALRAAAARRARLQVGLADLRRRSAAGARVEEVLAGGARLVAEALGADGWQVLQLVGWAPQRTAVRPWPGVTAPVRRGPGAWSRDLTARALACGGVLEPGRPEEPSLVVVLASPQGPVGLLALHRDAPRSSTPEELQLAASVGELLGSSVALRESEDGLERREELKRLLLDLATRFTSLAPDDVHRSIDRALADVGAHLGCALVALHRVSGDGAAVRPTHRWAAPDADTDAQVPVEDPEWLEAVLTGRSVVLRASPARPHPLLVVPLRVDGRATGAVTLVRDALSSPWQEDIPARLLPLGAALAGATARMHAVNALHESERRYRDVVDSVADIIVHAGPDGQVAFINRAWTEFTGLSLEETVGGDPLRRIHPDDKAVAAAHLHAAITGTDDGSAREVRMYAHDGSVRWMEVKGRALRDDEGALAGFSGIVHDVTERREAEARVRRAAEQAEQARREAEQARDEAEQARDEAERARDEAERSSRAKSEFLSRMSHELRTPLNAILGFGQLLQLADLAEEDGENVDQILRAGRHLLDLINEVLDVVRIESGALTLSIEAVDVGDVVAESLDLVRTAAGARGITLRAPARRCGLLALADRQRLKQVLINLLSNTVKYGRDDGESVVRCEVLPPDRAPQDLADPGFGWLRLSVADDGRGIPADRIKDVFTPFERLGAETTSIEGSGVGLSVTRTLVEALGGRVDLCSEQGRGTTFWVDLPLAEAPTSCPVPAGAGAVGDAAGAPGPRRTVLYVEDNPSNVMLVRRVLSRRPHLHLVVAHDGADGLEEAARSAPDLVLLDLHLPSVPGQEVLAALREHADPALREVPVVVVSADVSAGTEARVLAAGATAFLPKPLDVRHLLEVLDERVPVS
ncbi:ATP-binding protein [Quadrisphaera sp. DSM 44207]|uniref:ATP-binding protein n=1 Tax=Quadrisphaera sp. DSM 44207 TaxID=1881057 RepID=UPI0008801F3D|nr:ATP-binding protein [Quadrisphaera sp. DSM 44207]SDQ87854.1 PAS domain S-box-containing protein [Quadrisphaera sp. DSM 44207]